MTRIPGQMLRDITRVYILITRLVVYIYLFIYFFLSLHLCYFLFLLLFLFFFFFFFFSFHEENDENKKYEKEESIIRWSGAGAHSRRPNPAPYGRRQHHTCASIQISKKEGTTKVFQLLNSFSGEFSFKYTKHETFRNVVYTKGAAPQSVTKLATTKSNGRGENGGIYRILLVYTMRVRMVILY